jgi:hypothetical protein
MGNGQGDFEETEQLAVSAETLHGIVLGDLDGDTDIDLVSVVASGEVGVFVNNGDGTFQHQESYPLTSLFQGAVIADFNGDGLGDVAISTLDAGLAIFLNETETRTPGDANLDGVFDRMDIVQVLQTSKYGTGGPATWAEGDWDGNGVFDQLDVIRALATARYAS